ncbi:MAG: phosphoribosylaminoimidazolesuccinocarboxamide synthase [Myxococcota bacterium]
MRMKKNNLRKSDGIKRGKLLHEGKAKILYTTNDKERLIMYFKDDATAFDGAKRGTIISKGIINNRISSHIFELLEKRGVRTHFIKRLSEREMLVRKTAIIPVEVVLRNVVAGSMAKRLGLKEGTPLKGTIVEFYYKDDSLGDPMINEDHAVIFNWATRKQLDEIRKISLKINKILMKFFKSHNIRLVDYKLEFGVAKGKIFLADEITPDGCRLWDYKTNEKLDKDRFRRDMGGVAEAYAEVFRRVLGEKFK